MNTVCVTLTIALPLSEVQPRTVFGFTHCYTNHSLCPRIMTQNRPPQIPVPNKGISGYNSSDESLGKSLIKAPAWPGCLNFALTKYRFH
ncbi:hypothetical protein XELAEV_18043423mg [Xenopus laevis]|uniref:Uncharacterized protein n=1 Tax=Xenopus laevis TaxID=8355 RepID=A0A974H2D0_XENLA|nr:hypothetical protein XELAEV_18043423mg [Xenopus laevis]